MIGLFAAGCSVVTSAQNCNVFLYQKDTLQYEACLMAENAAKFYQYSWEYQEILDKALEICPRFSYAYRYKSIAYLKSGDFINWKYLIDKAVEYDKLENLGYRGWCRFQFFRDYLGAIQDIEELQSVTKGNIGYSAGGEYHLIVAKALCYKKTGDLKKAISIMEAFLAENPNHTSVFDYLHLGVMYLEDAQYDKAIHCFAIQSQQNELAENQFYLAQCYKYKHKSTEYYAHLTKAEELYRSGRKMYLAYTEPIDRIYLEDILIALKQ